MSSACARVVAACRLVLTATLLLLSGPARADAFDDATRKLSPGGAGGPEAGIAELGSLGDVRGLPVLEALEAGTLRLDDSGRPFRVEGGTTTDLTGAGAPPSGALVEVSVNNKVRRLLGPALAQLRLASPDPAVRLAAASELTQRSTPEAAAWMRAALAREKDGDVRDALTLGVARIDMESDDDARRLEALAVVEDSGDVSFRSALERMAGGGADGAPGASSEAVRAAAARALSAVNGRAFLVGIVANLFYGLSLGSVLLLAALGLAITFGLMRVINMAHGEMLMLGAYATYVMQGWFQRSLPGMFDAYLVAAIPFAFVTTMLVGVVLERTVIRFLYGRPLETLLATWGLSLVLIQSVRLVFGAQNVSVANPSWLSGGWELMPTIVLPYSRLAVIGFVVVVVTFVYVVLQRTPIGLLVRAVTQNREMAAGLGISTRRVDTWTFGLGCGVAGLGGVALSQLGNVGPELGQSYIVDSFMVVVVGGVGNVIGTVVGATGLGVLNKFLEPIAGAVLGKILILVLLVLFIQRRPQGMFALKGRAAEA